MFKRAIDLEDKLKVKSHFLLGPRAIGKSYLIRESLPTVQVFDFLDFSTFHRFLQNPSLLESEIKSKWVVIDEVQKVPAILDEVHRLIELKRIHFLLTGSSARKLRRGGTNLLAGRARWLEMYPLILKEIPQFDLLKYCRYGGLPMTYSSAEPLIELKNYIQLYLREEIMAEALVRKLDLFSRFIDVIGQRSGEELNYDLIGSDAGVPSKTVVNFVDVLKDTLLCYELLPFKKTKKNKSISKSKLFLFDVGVANYLARRTQVEYKSESFGKSFEHFIINEIRAFLGYAQLDLPLQYWRTIGGIYEVDCIVGEECAIEIKAGDKFNERQLKNILALKEEKKIKKYYLVSRDPVERFIEGINVCPWDIFIKKLWAKEII